LITTKLATAAAGALVLPLALAMSAPSAKADGPSTDNTSANTRVEQDIQAVADEPNCSSGRDSTARWRFWANCTNRAHRVGVTCHTQSKGNITLWGAWQNPNVQSVVVCPEDTRDYSGLGADYPD